MINFLCVNMLSKQLAEKVYYAIISNTILLVMHRLCTITIYIQIVYTALHA